MTKMSQPNDPRPLETDEVVSRIREGWDYIRLQSPLAAWGSWQKAIRLDPSSDAANQALATLEAARELPAAARARYLFLPPKTTERRERWDACFLGDASENLDEAASVFSKLTEVDPLDAEAWYNRGLCYGWAGHNAEAINCFDRFANLSAANDFESVVSAWILAEVLRQGKGAEQLADELRFVVTLSWNKADSTRLEEHVSGLRPIPSPALPTAESFESSSVRVSEWLEPIPSFEPDQENTESSRGFLAVATLFDSGRTLRLSSPRPDALESALETLGTFVDLQGRGVQREAAPLPLAFLDAAIWTFRTPPEVEQEVADRLTREHVESYYEDYWIHVARNGLDQKSPLQAAALARSGDMIAKAKLTAVVQFQEQLGNRGSVGRLYQGYPFDRLRNRLGLELDDPGIIDPADLGSASLKTLERLDPTNLPDHQLVSAFRSADGLRDDRLASKFAGELMSRNAESRRGVNLVKPVACLVRHHMNLGAPDQALGLIERAEHEVNESGRQTLRTWRAEILAREGREQEAMEMYRELIATAPNPAALALDAGETFLSNDQPLAAIAFLEQAIQSAREEDLPGVELRARALLQALDTSE